MRYYKRQMRWYDLHIKEIEKSLEIYNKLIDENPMKEPTTDVENVYSKNRTFKELLK